VMKGFIIGLALTIIVGQLPKLFGIEKTPGVFFEQLWGFLGELGNTSGLTLLVGVCSLVLVLGLKAYAPVVPASLVAVLLGIGAVSVFDLDVAIVGPVDSGLPSFGLPDVEAHDYLDLAASAIGVMLIGLMEGLGAAKTYAAKHHYEIDVNRELIGLGTANLGAGLSSGMVVGGSLSKTAVNDSAGARSQLSGLVVAVLTVITLLFLTGLFENLPEATLAAIVITAVIDLVNLRALVHLYRFHARGAGRAYAVAARPDFVGAVAALAGVLIFDTLPGLFIGIGVSIVLLIYRASRPHIAILGRDPGDDERWNDLQRHPDNEPEPGIVVVRCESALIFANAETVRDAIRANLEHDTFAVVIDAETVPAIDVTAVSMLVALADDLRRDGIELAFARDIGDVRELVQLGASDAPLARYPTVKAAVDALRSKATA
jgi:SulP family sulfate permease